MFDDLLSSLFINCHRSFCTIFVVTGKVFSLFFIFQSFRLSFLRTASMSSHKTNTNKPQALKCCHFCFSFDLLNHCPICREAGNGDDPCVTQEKQCQLCSSFTEEQNCKIRLKGISVPKRERNYTIKVSTLHFLLQNPDIQIVSVLLFIQVFWFLASYRPSSLNRDTVNGTQTGILKHSF